MGGLIRPKTMAWNEGNAEWAAARMVPKLSRRLREAFGRAYPSPAGAG